MTTYYVTVYPHENGTYVAIAPETTNTPSKAGWFTSSEQPSREAAINTLYTILTKYHPQFRLQVLGSDEVTVTHIMEFNQERINNRG